MNEVIYLSETGVMITADSEPDLDDWGWDEWWDCDEWITWHKLMKRRYGKLYANQKFAYWWNEQTTGAGPLDCRTLNSSFRAYIERNDLHSAVWEGAGIFEAVLDPVGSVGDVGTGLIRGVSRTGRALKWIIPTAIGLTLAYGGYRLYQYERNR